jgi:hypothetical protein
MVGVKVYVAVFVADGTGVSVFASVAVKVGSGVSVSGRDVGSSSAGALDTSVVLALEQADRSKTNKMKM